MYLFEKGGLVMLPLAACSLIAVAVCLERMLAFYLERRNLKVAELWSFLDSLRKKNSPSKVVVLSSHPILSRVEDSIASGNFQVVRQIVEVEVSAMYMRLQKNLSILGVIVAIAPLLGILGTVTGIISSFSVLQEAMLSNPNLVGAGLSEALLTTAVGLTITVPALIALTYFQNRSETIVHEVDQFAEELEIFLLSSKSSLSKTESEAKISQAKAAA